MREYIENHLYKSADAVNKAVPDAGQKVWTIWEMNWTADADIDINLCILHTL